MKTESKDTRQHILDVGYKLIVRKGFSSVGLAEILKSAGVPKGSFYHYFKSKEQFGEKLIINYFREYLAALEGLFQPQINDQGALSRLLGYFQRWIETQSDVCNDKKCLVVKLSAEVADLSEPMRRALLKGSSQIIERISHCIEDGINDGSIIQIDAGVTAELLYNMWIGASLMSKLQKNDEALRRSMKTTELILTRNNFA